MSETTGRLRWAGSAISAAVATVILVAIVIAAPQHRQLAAKVYVILMGVIVARLLVRAVVAAAWAPGPYRFDLALRAPDAPDARWAPDIGRIAQELGAATNRALELHYKFRRRLREIAADRSFADHGLAFDDDVEARRLVGATAWELLRLDREPPVDRLGPGMPLPELEQVVAAVERL
jgi:hypothetical protein